jgi:hypothetical protein
MGRAQQAPRGATIEQNLKRSWVNQAGTFVRASAASPSRRTPHGRLAKPARSRAPSGRSPRRLQSGLVLPVRVGAVAAPLTRPRPFRQAPCGRSRNGPRPRSPKFCGQGHVALERARKQWPNRASRVPRLPGDMGYVDRVIWRSDPRALWARCIVCSNRLIDWSLRIGRDVFGPASCPWWHVCQGVGEWRFVWAAWAVRTVWAEPVGLPTV